MKASEIRQTFLGFMENHGHAILPSAPVVPENDPTTLFTVAGMHPLMPYLLGEPHPAGKRLADVQKVVRTIDIDEVGDYSHLTMFEMLGNWSLGGYFKEDAIAWAYELLTDGFKLDSGRFAVSVFEGDEDAPRDNEAAGIWQKVGISQERIFYYGKSENWWGPPGQTGPCGPDTEVFYWTGEGEPISEPINDDQWLEIWNIVFMQYEKTARGKFKSLAQQNVDTGMGLERMAVLLQDKEDVYETDLFLPTLRKVRELAKKSDLKAERIIADHLKAATFMIADGVRPSNVEQGYILRRLIRRAIRQAKHLEINYPFTESVAEVVVENFQEAYPELGREVKVIREELLREEEKFARTIDRGLKEFEKIGAIRDREMTPKNYPVFTDGKLLFDLFQTYGFPLEVSQEELKAKGVIYNPHTVMDSWNEAFKAHQAQSRAGAKQKFVGGLTDDSEETVKLHTATHLLNAALQDVLGDHVKQRGSNITSERLRFDFSHSEKLTEEQLNQVEALVNEWIKEDLPVTRKEMPLVQAERIGAQMEFGHKYPDVVSVYFVGNPASARSKEFCGGPHVGRTGEIGEFKIKKQESVGAGVRRLKAVTV